MAAHDDEHAAAVGTPDLVLGPDEIINYALRKATRGYAVKDVDDLLDQLAVQTQDLLARLTELEADREELRGQLAEASESESMLKRTLVTAQRAAEASVAEAREEAEALRQRARERAEELLASAAEQAQELRDAALRRARADEADLRRYRRDVEEHIESLRTFAADHRARLAHHLELQRERLDEMELPDAPPPPSLPEDEILDAGVTDVDVTGIVAQLEGDTGDPVEARGAAPDDPQDAVPDDAGDGGLVASPDEPVREPVDAPDDTPVDGPVDDERPVVDTEERLFDA